jgi:hypothetical protein
VLELGGSGLLCMRMDLLVGMVWGSGYLDGPDGPTTEEARALKRQNRLGPIVATGDTTMRGLEGESIGFMLV